ncbi:MAG TPA: ATP-grasp domain-containing protein [Bacillota bacterium]|nr:ATP-grasp domain-containing protein [Bacillota bacterium]
MAAPNQLGTPTLLFQHAVRMGLQPQWLRPDGPFAITVDGQEKYIYLSRSPLNSHISVGLCTDKHVTRLILERHHLPNIPFTKVDTHSEAVAFLRKYGQIIAKPQSGSGARDIHVISTSKQLSTLDIRKYILEQYIAGKEMRYLVLNDEVVGVYQSDYGVSVEAGRALSCISYAKQRWDPEQVKIAVRIARILGLKFTAVDFLIDTSGRAYVLEVNAQPDLKWFHAPSSGPAVDVAGLFMEALLENQTIGASNSQQLALETPTIIGYN